MPTRLSQVRSMVLVAAAAVVLVAGCGGSGAADEPGDTAAAGSVDLSAGASVEPQGMVVSGVFVERVVDGDTLKVDMDGQDVTVRMIGMNTPETVKPDSPVECFGPEASAFAKQALEGQTVTLELDDSQGATDQYGRMLAYVWLQGRDGSLALFNLAAVAGGYAEERQYGSEPFAWSDEFRAAEDEARDAGLGLWGACQS